MSKKNTPHPSVRPAAKPAPSRKPVAAKRKQPAASSSTTKKGSTAKPPTGVGKERKQKIIPPSRARTVTLPTSGAPQQRGKSYAERASSVIEGTAVRVERKESDPFALPPLPELPSLDDVQLSGFGFVDPIVQANSDLRTFGPDLDDNPMDEVPDDLTHEDRETAKIDTLHAGFRQRMLTESKRRELATDTEYWCCIVFQDRDQKDQFLTRAGWGDLGDKYIDGERLAELIGVDVDKSEIVYNIGGADPKLAALVDIDRGYGSEPNDTDKRKRKRR